MGDSPTWPLLAAAALLLAGCAAPQPAAPVPDSLLPAVAPVRWHAPTDAPAASPAPPPAAGDASAAAGQAQPHGGSLQELLRWWRAQGDPLLVELIEASQKVSPTVASAGARLVEARAARTGAQADLLPSLEAAGSATRSQSLVFPGVPARPVSTARLGLQTAWEIDLFGAGRSARDAAAERLRGAQADWHEARVSVAAEVAVQYDLLRQCRRLAQIQQRDAASRVETARLTELAGRAGFSAPADVALARAGAADAASRAARQEAQCEQELKALVALTAWPEPGLRERLAQMPEAASLRLPALALDSVPARALSQRPDVFSAERAVLAARAEIAGAQAQRLPRLSLTGFVGASALRAGGAGTDASTWSFGPLSLSVPLLDGGRRSARVDAARARHDEAVAGYAARVRQAVREVESALVALRSTADRGPQVEQAAAGFRDFLQATEARQRAGLASLLELEEARRQQLAAEIALADWQTQVRAAHVSLYRAVGGGWSPALLDDPATSQASPNTR